MQDEDFEWDDAKASENLARHGVSFEAASLAFDDAFAVVRGDRRQDYDEERFILLRMVQARLLAVSYTLAWRAGAHHLGLLRRAARTATVP